MGAKSPPIMSSAIFMFEKLNEDVDVSGRGLDIPGAELDDADEKTGNEDEENNSYSWGQ